MKCKLIFLIFFANINSISFSLTRDLEVQEDIVQYQAVALIATSYHVNEPIYNETNKLSYKNIRIQDPYNVPKDIVALSPIFAKKHGIKLGDTIQVLENNVLRQKLYYDNMSSKGKYYLVNQGRIDNLVNKNVKLISKPVYIIITKIIKVKKRLKF